MMMMMMGKPVTITVDNVNDGNHFDLHEKCVQ